MRTEGFYDSCGAGKIHYLTWTPEGRVRGVVQIIHGMAEMASRYDAFAETLNSQGYLVAAEDHMGHGGSVHVKQGYFEGGWESVVKDCLKLKELIRQDHPEVPYVFLGHSMGSFLLRTILCLYPEDGYDGAILSGTGWQPRAGLPLMEGLCRAVCRKEGEQSETPFLNRLIFGSYNQKVEHRRTAFDWLSRDPSQVDAYIASHDCGFPITAGMFRDLMMGLQIIEKPENLLKMKKDLPVLLLGGSMDPVGSYGKGVRRTAREFQMAGLQKVQTKIYPLCRHELLNEINREEVYGDIAQWLQDQGF